MWFSKENPNEIYIFKILEIRQNLYSVFEGKSSDESYSTTHEGYTDISQAVRKIFEELRAKELLNFVSPQLLPSFPVSLYGQKIQDVVSKISRHVRHINFYGTQFKYFFDPKMFELRREIAKRNPGYVNNEDVRITAEIELELFAAILIA